MSSRHHKDGCPCPWHSGYHPDKLRPRKHHSDCSCMFHRSRQNLERGAVVDGKKKCSRCGEIKPVLGFYVRSDTKKPRSECIACRKLQRYGITATQYARLLDQQKGRCPLCGEPATCVDHDHKTGTVRGLLCSNCNWDLGKHPVVWYKKVVAYLTAGMV